MDKNISERLLDNEITIMYMIKSLNGNSVIKYIYL